MPTPTPPKERTQITNCRTSTCVKNLIYFFRTKHEQPAPGRSSLYGLDRGKFENRLIYDRHAMNYDALDSTLTYLLHYDALRYDIAEGLDRYCTMTSGLACTI